MRRKPVRKWRPIPTAMPNIDTHPEFYKYPSDYGDWYGVSLRCLLPYKRPFTILRK